MLGVIPKKQKRREQYNIIGGWKYQVNRSRIFDGFECGDLDLLFDESKVVTKIIPYRMPDILVCE